MSLPDHELVARAQAGSLEAFDELLAKHQRRVYVLAHRVMGNPDEADDIHQEAFIRAWKCLKSFRGQCEFSTWIYRITVNLCLSRKRRKSSTYVEVEFDEAEETGQCRRGVICTDRTVSTIAARQILASLPPRYSALLTLRELEGYSYQEIAEILECSVDSVKTGLHRARKLLLEKTEQYLHGDER